MYIYIYENVHKNYKNSRLTYVRTCIYIYIYFVRVPRTGIKLNDERVDFRRRCTSMIRRATVYVLYRVIRQGVCVITEPTVIAIATIYELSYGTADFYFPPPHRLVFGKRYGWSRSIGRYGLSRRGQARHC